MRFKCTLMYDGTNYSGFQTQLNKTTVQETIEKVISSITNEPIKITASGRTDAKVHAKGQVFHFDTTKEYTVFRLKYAINGKLPKDIQISEMEIVDELFHSRFCVKSKQYDYVILNEVPNVFLRNYSTFIKNKLDVEAMKQAASVFIGEHDFTSFCANSKEEMDDQVRNVYDITITQEDHLITLHFFGEGFMRYMVRMMSAALIEVGMHRMTKADIQKILDLKSKTAFNKNAEPQGLFLTHIDYFKMIYECDKAIIREAMPYELTPCKYVIAHRKTNKAIGFINDEIEWLIEDKEIQKTIEKYWKNR